MRIDWSALIDTILKQVTIPAEPHEINGSRNALHICTSLNGSYVQTAYEKSRRFNPTKNKDSYVYSVLYVGLLNNHDRKVSCIT